MSRAELIAVDWGTTNRRVYALSADGEVIDSVRDDRGMSAMRADDYPGEVERLRVAHGDVPVLIAGMAGSNRGWREAAYRTCPTGIDDLASAISWIEPGRTGIVPGVSTAGNARADVMRGEEVQLLGAVAAELVAPNALLCQPGTHCKWAMIGAGRIVGFATAMTGELFALLRQHSILSGQLDGEVCDGEAFRRGVADAANGDLLGRLFGVRAGLLLGTLNAEDCASYASGLLIGADVAARDLSQPVGILADPALGSLYRSAIVENDGEATILDSHAAFVAGITAIWRSL